MPVQLVLVLGAPSPEDEMLCWLTFGEHEALQGDMPKSRNVIPIQGKPTILKRTDHSQAVGINFAVLACHLKELRGLQIISGQSIWASWGKGGEGGSKGSVRLRMVGSLQNR